MKDPRFSKLTLAASLLLPLNLTMAQEGEDENPEEVFELSPFEVRGDTIGYYASSTLAGTRINTSIRDIASSVQVVTEEFMQDIGATNLDTLMQYTTSSETAGIQGNFVGIATPGGDQTSTLGTRANAGTTQRIRGLGAPDRTRNFFRTTMPFDSYNTTRVDINRGANSFLFGLGSPAGLINANLIRAEFRESSEISFRIGEGGSDPSTRVNVDFNRVLVDDVLAVRFAALYEDQKYYQRPSFAEDRRYFGTATYRPFRHTTIRAHFERAKQNISPPNPLLPGEALSMFLDPPEEIFARVSIDPVANVRATGNPQGPQEFRAGNRLRNFGGGAQAFQFVWDGQGGFADGPLYARSGHRGAIPRMPDPPPYYNTNPPPQRRPANFYVRHGNFRDYFDGEGFVQQGFLNLDTFDFARVNIAGDNDRVNRDFTNYNISLEQSLLDGIAGFEVAFDRQEYDFENYIVFGAGLEEIFFDINETLLFPDPQGDGLTPAPNPNYGRPTILTQTNSATGSETQETVRFTGYFRHDFRDHVDGFFGSLLGRHRLTFLFDQSRYNERFIPRKHAAYTPEGVPTDFSTDSVQRAEDFARTLFQVFHIGPQQLDAFTDPNFTLADFTLAPIQPRIPLVERTMPVQFWNVETNQWDETEVTGRWVPTGNQRVRFERVTSYALNTQSHLLNDMLVVNLGLREDQVKQRLRLNDAPIPEGSDTRDVSLAAFNLDGVPTITQRENIFGYGFVLNPPRDLLRFPDWFDMAIHYSESENFSPGSGQQDYLGRTMPPQTGTSKDYGFTLFLFDNKLIARVNWFRGALENAGSYQRDVNAIGRLTLNAYGNILQDIGTYDPDGNRMIDPELNPDGNRSDELLARTYAARDLLEASLDPRIFDVFNFVQGADGSFSLVAPGASVTDFHDNVTDGIEIEITANPVRGWRISLNVTKYQTALDNVAPRLTEFIDNVTLPLIEEFGDLNFGSPTLIEPFRTVREVINDGLFGYFESKRNEGLRATEQREWSVRAVTNYRFTRGPLRNVTVGGAYRWESGFALGYPTITTEEGLNVPDVDNPYMSSPQQNIDVNFGYNRRILNGAVDWSIRLNIRNVNNWNSNKTSVVRVQPDGSPARARFNPPREIFITNTFRF